MIVYLTQSWSNAPDNSIIVPCDSLASAKAAIEPLLYPTEIKYLKDLTAIDPTNTTVNYNSVEMVLKSSNKDTTYLKLLVKSSVDINHLKETFVGMNINNVLVDEVIVTRFKSF